MLWAALVFLIYLGWNQRALLLRLLHDANGRYLLLASGCWLCAHVVSPCFSRLLLDHSTHPVDYMTALRIHARNVPARYVPGGIWHTVGRLADFRELGVSPRRLARFAILENAIAASVTLMVGGCGVALLRGASAFGQFGAWCAIGGVVGLAASLFVANRWGAAVGDRLSGAVYAKSVAVTMLFWTFAAAAFLSYVHAFPGLVAPWYEIVSAYLLSWGVGFVAVFAPQGVGVFESVYAGLSAGALPLGAVAALVGGFRLVVLAADVSVWLIAGRLAAVKSTKPV